MMQSVEIQLWQLVIVATTMLILGNLNGLMLGVEFMRASRRKAVAVPAGSMINEFF